MHTNLEQLCEDLIQYARKNGADYADTFCYRSTSIASSVRLGEHENFEREEDMALGLRVFTGKSSACLSSSDLTSQTLQNLADQAITMARHVPEDEFASIPEHCMTPDADYIGALNLKDPAGEPEAQTLTNLAKNLEEIGRAHEGISNSDGAEASWSSSTVYLQNSTGFSGQYQKDYSSISLSLIAGEGTNMERDYAHDTALQFQNLDTAEDIAKLCAKRTLGRLNPKQGKTGNFPVIFDRRIAPSLLGHFLSGINGARIARGTSFLMDAMNNQVFSSAITIKDDPTLPQMLKTKPFDIEGQETKPMDLIDAGILKNWVLDLRSARKLGLTTNAHAARGLASQPSPSTSNTWIAPSSTSLDDMIADVKDGFYVTELIGSSVSMTTGDYSRGASGFWIENGQIAYPVSELTIAGNLKDIFLSMLPANDLRQRFGRDTPSLYIPSLTIAAA